jgi:hypothetical protein
MFVAAPIANKDGFAGTHFKFFERTPVNACVWFAELRISEMGRSPADAGVGTDASV